MRAQVRAPATVRSTKAPSVTETNLRAKAQPTPITVQLVQPPTQPQNPTLEAVQAYAPYVAAFLALLGVFGTAIYTLYRGRMDARYAYASEILKFRLRQIQEFYAPARLHIEQSRIVYEKLRWTLKQERKDIALDGFRLLDHIHEFKTDPKLKPLIDRILAIGQQLTTLISQGSGLIEGGITPTFVEYQGHFDILNAASEQELSKEQREGWHELGYYPRMLNREILEGYKEILKHLGNYANAGDQIICQLLKQKAVETGKYRRQLIENLKVYEGRARDYATRFDTFDLSAIRQRFIDEVESTRNARPQAFANGMIKILDVGCGTGRDTYEFLKNGYAVTAIDASPAMLRECRRKFGDALDKCENEKMKRAARTSLCVEMTFDEIGFRNEFDGVWAAASLLHVPSQEMEESLRKLIQALKPNGILFMSFKYGRGEHQYDARFYSYYGRKEIRALLKRIPSADEIEVWLSDAEGKNLPLRKQSWAWKLEFIRRYDRSRWLNVLARRKRV
jgi:SAM-dependent methyltransferase